MNFRWCSAWAAVLWAVASSTAAETVGITPGRDAIAITIGDRPFARYVFRDPDILRPYFTSVRVLSGLEVTRAHPPRDGVDATDHATMHPGIWLAFGDLDGADFWRNRGRVTHAGMVGTPESGPDFGRFTVKNRYFDGDRRVCEETCVVAVHVREGRVYLILESTFSGERAFAFGDQEEMGLGVRVATPMAVENGGRIENSDGLVNEAGCWGKQADWAEYSGMVNGERIGVVVMPHPHNFRRSWFHARDYGFMAANPFGRAAFEGGEPSRIEVKPGETLRVGFGVCVYSGEASADEAYSTYLDLIGAERAAR